MDFPLVATEVESDFLFERATEGCAGFELSGPAPCGIEEELAVNMCRGLEEVVGEVVQGWCGSIGELGELPEGCPCVGAFAVAGNVA